jgi:hypothetical protein
MNEIFWWQLPERSTFKTPVSEGRPLIPQEFLKPGFVPDVAELWYSFVRGRRDPRIIGDFSGWDPSAFFVNERGYRVFEDMFAKHGRGYRVRCDNQPYYIVLIDTLHAACDLGRSQFERFNTRERIEDDIHTFHRIALKKGFKTEDDIFRLDGSYALNRVMIVSNRFKIRYQETGLTGLFFTPAPATHL